MKRRVKIGWDISHLEFTIEDHYYFSILKSSLKESGAVVKEVDSFKDITRYDVTVLNYPEKTFTKELCDVMAASGCIAVTGGLEVASDRLLKLMEKGVSIEQVTKVTQAFTDAGIMVHAYLMYGFPTQTAQETIDSLEVVRQLFENGLLQSAFWHRFTMTAHSPVGKNPEKYKVIRVGPEKGSFANNDFIHEDTTGCDHDLFSEGLKIALYNYMQGLGFELPLQKWFEFKVPKTSHSKNLIIGYL